LTATRMRRIERMNPTSQRSLENASPCNMLRPQPFLCNP
jgi:hypothetical protein